MIPGSERNWIAVNAVQQSTFNKKMKTKNMTHKKVEEQQEAISRPNATVARQEATRAEQ
jgi:hypothetical protein